MSKWHGVSVDGEGRLAAVNLLDAGIDAEVATRLATISREVELSLCGIAPDQTEADFKEKGLKATEAILIAASLEFRGYFFPLLPCCSTSLRTLPFRLCNCSSTPAQSLRTHRPTAVLRGQEQALRSRLRSRPLNAPFVIVLRSSRCALGIPLHPLTPVPLQAPALY